MHRALYLLHVIVPFCICNISYASWFGPSNYAECKVDAYNKNKAAASYSAQEQCFIDHCMKLKKVRSTVRKQADANCSYNTESVDRGAYVGSDRRGKSPLDQYYRRKAEREEKDKAKRDCAIVKLRYLRFEKVILTRIDRCNYYSKSKGANESCNDNDFIRSNDFIPVDISCPDVEGIDYRYYRTGSQ